MMDVIKRKILLETLTDRSNSSTYGTITADTIDINIFLTQNIDDMGMFTDMEFIPDENGKTVEDYYSTGGIITGTTNSKLISLKTYKRNKLYDVDVINDSNTYTNYKGDTIYGVTKVIDTEVPVTYTFNGKNDVFLGTKQQDTGILYRDYPNITEFQYKSEGWNETNTSLSNLCKEEMLLGITMPPEVKSDVFIDRGSTSVLEPHYRLGEVETISHLEIYGNGYFKSLR